jgi:hypothetical protein
MGADVAAGGGKVMGALSGAARGRRLGMLAR